MQEESSFRSKASLQRVPSATTRTPPEDQLSVRRPSSSVSVKEGRANASSGGARLGQDAASIAGTSASEFLEQIHPPQANGLESRLLQGEAGRGTLSRSTNDVNAAGGAGEYGGEAADGYDGGGSAAADGYDGGGSAAADGEYGDPGDALGALAAAASADVVGRLPRYAAPNIASTLPTYRNEEQEFIFRTFAGNNYDMLRHLPANIREQQVAASRSARQEATRTFLMPGLVGSQLRLKSNPSNQQGLFTPFEYIPSRYSLAAELASKERVANEATRLAIGRGREFMPVVAPQLQKQHEIGPKVGYVYLAGPEEDAEELRQSERSHHEAAFVQPPFVPPGTQKLAPEVPTRLKAVEMMKRLKRALEADWEGAFISIFENEHDCWVVCFQEATVDGLDGLAAYMNVFVRTNPVANEYRLTKVVEYWGSSPGDGCVYYVMRPPWVAQDRLETFFKLHPEERDWRTSFPVVEMEAERREKKKALEAGQDELEVDQRLRQLSIRSRHVAPSNSGLASARSGSGSSRG